MRRRKCPVCGLYLGRSPHTGPIHERIFAARRRLVGSSRSGLRGRFRRRG